MAPFNWFNRQFSDPSDSEDQSTEADATSDADLPLVEEQPDAETKADEMPEVAQDQLNWAKLAYENIRKRQAAQNADEASPATSDCRCSHSR
jgi:fused signal recognition particle receptor